jgi:hypothetical protein
MSYASRPPLSPPNGKPHPSKSTVKTLLDASNRYRSLGLEIILQIEHALMGSIPYAKDLEHRGAHLRDPNSISTIDCRRLESSFCKVWHDSLICGVVVGVVQSPVCDSVVCKQGLDCPVGQVESVACQ